MTYRDLIVVLLVLCFAPTAFAGRYERLTEWASEGPKLEPVAATFFGGEGVEEFVAVAGKRDGSVVAFGNAWGPDFPSPPGAPSAEVLGDGRQAGLEPILKDRKGQETLDLVSPDRTGFIVFYAPRLEKIDRVVRFDWGIGSITAGAVATDGSIYITGHASPMFDRLAHPRTLKPDPSVFQRSNKKKQGARWGPFEHRGLRLAGNVYIARLSPDAKTITWAWVLEGFREAPDRLWIGANGEVTFACRGVRRITGDGRQIKLLLDKGESSTVGLRAVHADDGSFLWGGDNNTSTGREPWRRPYMRWYNADGSVRADLWGHEPRRVGSDGYRLVSDSAPRASAFTEDGHLLVSGWSDGGNSVFKRQPTDLDASTVESANGFSTWGMKRANSLGWIMLIDHESLTVKHWTQWVCYIPNSFENPTVRGAPNFAQIDEVRLLDAGHIGFAGRAATGLIQTPGAFYHYPDDGSKYGGDYAAVFSADMESLLFSSYLPGYTHTAIDRVPRGMVIAGRTSGDDAEPSPRTGKPTPSPTINAIQEQFGGAYDAHIILLQGR